MQCAEDQVTGKGCPNGDFCGFKIANFADHDHVRVLPEDMAQTHRECQTDFRTDRDLVDALEFVFDRFLDGDDPFVNRIDRAEEGVKRSRFARTGGTRNEENTVWLIDDFSGGLLLLSWVE